MSEPVAEIQGRWLPSYRFAAALAFLGIYFGLILVPEWWPGFARTGSFFFYMLSIPIVLVCLLGLILWGVVGAIAVRSRGALVSKRQHTFVVLSLAGLLMFGSTLVLARVIRGALPTGSHVREFVPLVWQDPTSSQSAPGNDITPRQMMLGGLVKRFKPSQSRTEIEALLGPSLQMPLFESTGRDLIYLLGPERTSFLSVDAEWLLIWLDDSGHFERYAIYTD